MEVTLASGNDALGTLAGAGVQVQCPHNVLFIFMLDTVETVKLPIGARWPFCPVRIKHNDAVFQGCACDAASTDLRE